MQIPGGSRCRAHGKSARSVARRRNLGAAMAGALTLSPAVVAGAASPVSAAPNPGTTFPIEARYKARGPLGVVTSSVKAEDGSVLYQLYYPTDLGGHGHSDMSIGSA